MFGFGNKDAAIDAFAVESCAALVQRFPPAREAGLGGDKKKLGKTLGNAMTDLQRRMIEFQTEQNLGIYGKARLLRAVQDELRRLQYSEMFVEAITDLLVPATAARLR